MRRHPRVQPARRRAAAHTEALARIAQGLSPADSIRDARDVALLLIGYAAALRTAELAGLELDDLTTSTDGLEIRLRRSKTDQTATGAVVGVTPGTRAHTDPVAAWHHWRTHLAQHGRSTGPAFRPVDRYGHPRTTRPTRSIRRIITARVAAAGLTGDYGGHSLRRGFATEALANGATELDVMRHGRWTSHTTMRGYVDAAHRFANGNPSRHLGL